MSGIRVLGPELLHPGLANLLEQRKCLTKSTCFAVRHPQAVLGVERVRMFHPQDFFPQDNAPLQERHRLRSLALSSVIHADDPAQLRLDAGVQVLALVQLGRGTIQ